ncbi:MAG: GNAT family N-acetyltransferase [Defluviitaleaceae bacterium]|nr:GNAT family N-acetyltransferase [Defluviitaleaceae bacterium]
MGAVAVDEVGNIVAFQFYSYKKSRGRITLLGVLPEHRGRGLATRLIETAKQELFETYGCHTITTEVTDDNVASFGQFEKLGFVRANIFKLSFREVIGTRAMWIPFTQIYVCHKDENKTTKTKDNGGLLHIVFFVLLNILVRSVYVNICHTSYDFYELLFWAYRSHFGATGILSNMKTQKSLSEIWLSMDFLA